MGTIDATYFDDKQKTGKKYLIWKTDGNDIGKPTDFLIRQLNEDGISFPSSAPVIRILTNDLKWE